MTASQRSRGGRLGAEVALAYATGAASFALVAVVLAVLEAGILVAVFGAACVAAVIAVARRWGVAYAVPAALAGVLAYDWYQFPPTHPEAFPDSANLANVLVYLAVAVLVGELAASAARRAEVSEREVARLADEQVALRRVATLVARGVPPSEVFAAVARELGQLLGVDTTHLGRFEPDGTTVGVGSWSRAGDHLPVGTRVKLAGGNVSSLVAETGRPARLDSYDDATGPTVDLLRDLGIRSSVGSPIMVDGRVWGVLIASSKAEAPLSADTEARIGEFSELVGTAISNAQARADLAESRARIVAATDEERRRVVRDLHDGAQQRLVHTLITLKLARHALERGDDDGVLENVIEALDNTKQTTVELRELAHGILPAALTHGGLHAGVDALASRMSVPVDNDVSVGRLPATVEATAYFVVAEALTNVAKHSRAGRAAVEAHVEDDTLHVNVRDDGVGGARADGNGLLGLRDRLAVLDGRLRVESPADGGTLLDAAIPLDGS